MDAQSSTGVPPGDNTLQKPAIAVAAFLIGGCNKPHCQTRTLHIPKLV